MLAKVQALRPLYERLSDLQPVMEAKCPAERVADYIFNSRVLPYFALDVVSPTFAQPLLCDVWKALAERWLVGDSPHDAADAYEVYLKILNHEGLAKMYLWGN